jgi:hypothetical protein
LQQHQQGAGQSVRNSEQTIRPAVVLQLVEHDTCTNVSAACTHRHLPIATGTLHAIHP